jgi:hypothetical protein
VLSGWPAADVMHDKLEDIAWTGEQPWDETLAVTSSTPVQIGNVDDDLERELAFYNQARPRICFDSLLLLCSSC